MRPIIAASLFVAIAATAGTVAAQPQAEAPGAAPQGAGAPAGRSEAMARLQAADTDKDGKWSKAEWVAAGRRDRGFEFLDTDKDGFVTIAELQGGMQRMRALRGGQ